MKRLILAGIIGGVILWIWGLISWTVIPLYTPTMRNIPNEDVVVETLSEYLSIKSIYIFPGLPKEDDQYSRDRWAEKYKRGPIGMIIYNPVGADPMMLGQFLIGFIIFAIASYIAAWFLSRSTAAMTSYLSRVTYCGMLGIFISLPTHLSAWNWMGYPFDFTTAMVADVVFGWIFAGLGIAGVVKSSQ